MKKIILFLLLSAVAVSAQSHPYTTGFPATENPISETGQWINGLVVGGSWGNVRTTPGFAFGTVQSTGCPSIAVDCNDSTAVLAGSWGATQYARGVVNTNSPSATCCHEVELRLRSTITLGVNKGYEANCSVSSTQTYIQVVRWNGPLGDYLPIDATDPGAPCAKGDLFEAMVSGSSPVVIKVWRNGLLVLTATDNLGGAITSGGSPGIGMFNNLDATQNTFGWSDFFACDTTRCPLLGVVAQSRVTDWTSAGSPVASAYPFNVDSWTQCGSTISAGASLTTVQNAINACTANHYVQLSAGTYNLSSGIVWNAKSGVALKGAGSNATFLVFSGGTNSTGAGLIALSFKSADLNYWGAPSNVANWTAGYTSGTSSVTLSSVANLAVGHPLTFDQTDDVSDNGAIFVSSGACCAINGDGGSPRPGRGQQQIVTVTSISGTTVGFFPPLRATNWSSGKTPQAWWPTSPISNSGFMDLSVDVSGPGANGLTMLAQFFNCNGCFSLRNRLIGPGVIGAAPPSTFRSLINRFQTARSTIAFNYFYGTPDDPSVNYGTEAIPSADDLILSNIFQHVQAPTPMDGTCSGCLVIYNFDTNDIFHNTSVNDWTFPNQGQFAHAVGDENIAFEGNQGSGIYNDQFHGTHDLILVFRNNYTGWQKDNGFQTTGGGTVPIIMPAYNRFSSFLGNVMGNPNRHTIYKTTSITPVGGTPNITLGFGFNGNDNNTASTSMLWFNFPACTGGAGCNSSQSNSADVPSGLTGTQARFANPVPASNALPGSIFYTAQPGWWPGGKPWPPIGPDVTSGNFGYCPAGANGGNYVNTVIGCPSSTFQNIWVGHAYTLPATDCYLTNMNGPTDGTGPVLAYDFNNCYAGGPPPPPPTPPAPASGLFATISKTLNHVGLENFNEKNYQFHIVHAIPDGTLIFSANSHYAVGNN